MTLRAILFGARCGKGGYKLVCTPSRLMENKWLPGTNHIGVNELQVSESNTAL